MSEVAAVKVTNKVKPSHTFDFINDNIIIDTSETFIPKSLSLKDENFTAILSENFLTGFKTYLSNLVQKDEYNFVYKDIGVKLNQQSLETLKSKIAEVVK